MTDQQHPAADAAQVAQTIATAYREGPQRSADVLAALLADTVSIVHEPPMPGDGPCSGALMGEMRRRESLAFQKALQGFREQAAVSVDGDCVAVKLTLSGRRANGEAVCETVTSKFRIANGKIVEMIAVPDSASFAVLGSVLQEGGFTNSLA